MKNGRQDRIAETLTKRVGMSICFFGHLKEEKYKWGQVGFH